ncbi:MAG TPA: PIN domain-containing protein [Acidimicrobiales bacterium]|nr:PIN domain-containing protein [Acidimicrobiales bacterium]
MIVVDTSVLIYATGRDHPLRAPCRCLVEAIGDGRIEATTTVEVVQEFVHVCARRVPRVDAVDYGRELSRLLRPLLTPQEGDLLRGLDLFERHDGIGMFDAVLAATALAAGDGVCLVSGDRGFAMVPGLHHLDPADDGFLPALGIG